LAAQSDCLKYNKNVLHILSQLLNELKLFKKELASSILADKANIFFVFVLKI
jgi:hypothetical protein